jgi:hypothetical protein
MVMADGKAAYRQNVIVELRSRAGGLNKFDHYSADPGKLDVDPASCGQGDVQWSKVPHAILRAQHLTRALHVVRDISHLKMFRLQEPAGGGCTNRPSYYVLHYGSPTLINLSMMKKYLGWIELGRLCNDPGHLFAFELRHIRITTRLVLNNLS